jgi:hypothetical protein
MHKSVFSPAQDAAVGMTSDCLGFLGTPSGGHKGHVNCVQFDADGAYLFSGDSVGVVRIWAINGQPHNPAAYAVCDQVPAFSDAVCAEICLCTCVYSAYA